MGFWSWVSEKGVSVLRDLRMYISCFASEHKAHITALRKGLQNPNCVHTCSVSSLGSAHLVVFHIQRRAFHFRFCLLLGLTWVHADLAHSVAVD